MSEINHKLFLSLREHSPVQETRNNSDIIPTHNYKTNYINSAQPPQALNIYPEIIKIIFRKYVQASTIFVPTL